MEEIVYVKVNLDEYQAKQFVLFQQKYLQIIKMIQTGAFDLQTGRIIIDVQNGNFKEVEISKKSHFE